MEEFNESDIKILEDIKESNKMTLNIVKTPIQTIRN